MNLQAKLRQAVARLWNGKTGEKTARSQISVPGRAARVVEDALGFKFVLYPFDRLHEKLLLERAYDRELFAAMSLLIRPGDVVFDVGAHIGEISVLAARLCGPQGKVFAFEPVPESCARFRENVALNGCENIFLQPVAVAEYTGTVTMNVFPSQYSAWNSRGRPVYTDVEGVPVESTPIEVPATTLDEFRATHGIERIQFLKVDVEGHEHAVFGGAARLLGERDVDTICFEISQIPLQGAGRTAREIFEILESHKYSVYRFDERSERFTGPVRDSTEVWTNYFAAVRAPVAGEDREGMLITATKKLLNKLFRATGIEVSRLTSESAQCSTKASERC